MAYIEISSSKMWSLFQTEVQESADEATPEKLMKLALRTAKDYGEFSLEITTLKRMIKFAEERMKEIENY